MEAVPLVHLNPARGSPPHRIPTPIELSWNSACRMREWGLSPPVHQKGDPHEPDQEPPGQYRVPCGSRHHSRGENLDLLAVRAGSSPTRLARWEVSAAKPVCL